MKGGAFEPHADRAGLLAWIEARFGIPPAAFDDFDLLRRGKTTWLARRGVVPPTGVEVLAVGTAVLRGDPPRIKPTSVFLQRFGHLATRAVQTLPDEAVGRFLAGEAFPADDGLRGYVIVRTGTLVVGCGLARDGALTCQIPRAWLSSRLVR